jgi:hypothetical protein
MRLILRADDQAISGCPSDDVVLNPSGKPELATVLRVTRAPGVRLSAMMVA